MATISKSGDDTVTAVTGNQMSVSASSQQQPQYHLRSRHHAPAQTAVSTPAAPAASANQNIKPQTRSDTEEAGLSSHEAALERSLTAAAQEPSSFSGASCYWDAASMAPLTPQSAAAIARLRAYKPPNFPAWDKLPASRRAAVLVLLYADRRGDLRVVITMRAASLRSFSGQAALPGGKADSLSETGYQIARREAWEEIGLPLDDTKIPNPFTIESLCDMPCSLARTEIAVRPCVAFLHAEDNPGDTSTSILAEEAMMPRLDAKEVAAVFSAPLFNFLRSTDRAPLEGEKPDLPPGQWYDGHWTRWHNKPWRVHNFHVPVHDQRVVRPKVRESGQAALADRLDDDGGSEEDDEAKVLAEQRFLVWGMTGRILVDVARVAYGQEPQFEVNEHYGDEEVIERLQRQGLLGEKRRRGERDVGQEAIKEVVKDEKM